jgi:hypothetical protein
MSEANKSRDNTPKDWEAIVVRDMAFAKKIMRDKGEISGPIFILHSDDAIRVMAMAVPHEQRADYYKIVRCMCIKHNVYALTAILEAWYLEISKRDGETEEEHKSRAKDVLPSESPDRKEIVSTHLFYRKDNKRLSIVQNADILRDSEGKLAGFKDWDIEHADGGDRRMQGMVPRILPEEEPSPELRRLAEIGLPIMANVFGMEVSEAEIPSPGNPQGHEPGHA